MAGRLSDYINANHPTTSKCIFSVLTILGIAACLRGYNPEGIHNYIDGLSARQAMITLDIRQGIHHLPFSVYLLEFDEPGLAYLTYPLTCLMGFKWRTYQIFAVISGAVTAVVVFAFVCAGLGFTSGLAAGLLYASMPCLLVWNRYYFMSGGDWITLFSLSAFSMLLFPSRIRRLWPGIAGGLLGLGMHLTSLVGLSIPVAMIIIGYRTCWNTRSKKTCVEPILWFVTAFVLLTLDIVRSLASRPYYIKWRMDHFIQPDSVVAGISAYLKNAVGVLYELAVSGRNYLCLPGHKAPLSPLISILAVIGFVHLFKQRRTIYFAIPAMYLLVWGALMAVLKSGTFRGPYSILIIPYVLMAAGYGACIAVENLKRLKINSHKRSLIFTILLSIWTVVNAWSFLAGSWKMPFRNDTLTRLQKDLWNHPDIPVLVDHDVTDASFYHFPFWFVMRSCVSRVTIIECRGADFTVKPDDKPLHIAGSEYNEVMFLIDKANLSTFYLNLVHLSTQPPEACRESGLFKLRCRAEVGEYARRTWRDTSVPPIIGLPGEQDRD